MTFPPSFACCSCADAPPMHALADCSHASTPLPCCPGLIPIKKGKGRERKKSYTTVTLPVSWSVTRPAHFSTVGCLALRLHPLALSPREREGTEASRSMRT